MVTYPKDWNETKLLDCVRLVQGLTYTPERVKPYGTLVLRSSNIQNNRLSLLDNVYVDMQVPQDKMIEAGDILVCVRNGSAALIGKSCVLQALPNTTFGAFMSVLRGDTTGFIAKLVESDIVQNQVKDRSNATINQITKKDFESVSVTVPDKPEQSEIAKVLLEIASYIDNLTELIEKKKAIRDGALEDLLSGRTRLVGFSGEWEEYSFDDFFTLLPNNTLSREKLSERGAIGNIHYGDVLIKYHNNVTDKDDIPRIKADIDTRSFRLLQSGDIIVADTAEDETVGKAIQICDVSIPLVGGLHTIVCRPNYDTALGYLGYYINSKNYHNQLFPHITGIKVSSISKKAIKTTVLNLPKDIDEQKAIVEVLSSLDAEIASLDEGKDKMLQIKAGAMDDLLTGRVRLMRQGG